MNPFVGLFFLAVIFQYSSSAPLSDEEVEKRAILLANDLGLNFLQFLQQNDDKNVLINPIGLQRALLTLLSVSQGETEKELKQILELNDNGNYNSLFYYNLPF